jgi:hypothetical protein
MHFTRQLHPVSSTAAQNRNARNKARLWFAKDCKSEALLRLSAQT